MTAESVQFLALTALPAILFAYWVWLVGTRRLSGFGIVFGAGATFNAILMSFSVVGPFFDPSFGGMELGVLKLETGPLAWFTSLGITVAFALAVHVAARAPRLWSATLIAAVSIFVLSTCVGKVATFFFMAPADVQITLGDGWSVSGWFIGPALFCLFILPFIPAIPWVLLRQLEAGRQTRSPIRISIHALTMPTMTLEILAIGLLILPFVFPKEVASQAHIFLSVSAIIVVSVLIAVHSIFRFKFFVPALTLVDFVQKPLSARGETPPLPAVWRPVLERLHQLEVAQQRMTALFSNMPADLWVCDLEGHLLLENSRGPHSDHETDDSRRMSVFQGLLPEEAAHAMEIGRRIVQTGEPIVEDNVTSSRYPGEIGLTVSFPIRNPAGAIDSIGVARLDVTEARKSRDELDNTRAILESLVEHAPFPVGLADPYAEGGMRVFMLNPSARAWYGEEASEAILAGDIAPMIECWPEWNEKGGPTTLKVIETGVAHTVEALFRHVDGKDRPTNGTIFPVRDKSGKLQAIGSIVMDLSDFHEARTILDRTRDAIHQSEKLAALGQLVAGVAHELNNPLAVVLGRAELLEEQLGGAAQAASLRKLTAAADRCARIVKAFLAMARQTGPRQIATDINLLIDMALDLTSHGLGQTQIKVTLDLEKDLPDIVADDDQLVQVLINLLINAQHALEESNEPRHLALRTRHLKDLRRIAVEVEDNGPGVPEHMRERLFEPFFTTKDVGIGTGLGLSVCKGIIDAHGGSLSLHAGATGGALFRIMLPVDNAPIPSGDQKRVADLSQLGGRVLIVDDEPDVADMLAESLSSLQLDCHIVHSGEAALARLAERDDYVAIFCDVRMPRMNGFDLFERVAEAWPHVATRFVFVSGDVLHRDFSGRIAAIGRPIIEKPFNFSVVRETAQAVIAQKGDTQ